MIGVNIHGVEVFVSKALHAMELMCGLHLRPEDCRFYGSDPTEYVRFSRMLAALYQPAKGQQRRI